MMFLVLGILNSLLRCPHYVCKVYMALLKVIAKFDDDLKTILCNVKGGKREVKKVVHDYVKKSGIQKVSLTVYLRLVFSF